MRQRRLIASAMVLATSSVVSVNILHGDALSDRQGERPWRRLSLAAKPNAVGKPSPDGRFVAFREATTTAPRRMPGSLAVGDFNTGETRVVISHTDEEGLPPAGEAFAWSSDGKRLAYSWCTVERPALRKAASCEVRVTAVTGSDIKTILPRRLGQAIPWAWTPDGRDVLTIIVGPQGPNSELALVNVTDGSKRTLLVGVDAAHFDTTPGAFSPDGKYFAFTRTLWQEIPYSAQLPGDVEIVAIDGSEISKVVDHAADDNFVAWTPDGRGLLFDSDRAGSTDLWRVDVKDGAAMATPLRLRADVGRVSNGVLTPEGELVYRRGRTYSQDVLTASLDASSPASLGPPTSLTADHTRRREMPRFSPDGRWIAYRTGAAKPVPDFPTDGFDSIAVQEVGSKVAREIPLPHPCTPEWHGMSIEWTPDSRGLVLSVLGSRNTCRGIFALDIATGGIEAIAQDGTYMTHATPLPDGSVAYVTRQEVRIRHRPSNQDRVVRDLTALPEFENQGIDGMAVSTDGQAVALASATAVVLLKLSDGSVRKISSRQSERGGGWVAVAWTPDNKHVLFTERAGDGAPDRVWRVAVDDGSRVKVDFPVRPGDQIESLHIHPDGRVIAFGRYSEERATMAAIDRVLPPADPRGDRQ